MARRFPAAALHAVLLCGIASVWWTSAAAGAHDPALLMLLSQLHRDPSPEELRHFGPGVEDALRAIVGDAMVPRLARVRAVSVLGYFDSEGAFETVRRAAFDPALPLRVRSAAVWTLGHRFEGRSGRLEALQEVLRLPQPLLRETAVRSLAVLPDPKARALLARHRQVERHRAVLRTLRAVLRAELQRPLPPEGVQRRPAPTEEPAR